MKKSKQPIESFDLSPNAKGGISVVDMQMEIIEHEIFEPHRDEHYLLFIGKGGSYSLMLDFQEFLVDKPAFLFIAPGQVHQILEIKNPEGYSISFDKASVYGEMQHDLKRILNVPFVLEVNAIRDTLFSLASLLYELQQTPSDLFVKRASQGILHSLLNLIASLSIAYPGNVSAKKKRASVICGSFMALVEKSFKEWKEPSLYANALSISTNHLNDVIKESTGKSVTAHIHNQSILEAKRLLYFTDLTVKEICYATGYLEAVYFNKLFKKTTHLTPLEFRNKFRV